MWPPPILKVSPNAAVRVYNAQYPYIKFVQLPLRNHDRFLIIDGKAYLLGASLKDMGVGLCAITEMNATPESILELVTSQ